MVEGTAQRLDELHPMQAAAWRDVIEPYLTGEQDGQEWALIDNHSGDDLRYALQAAILRWRGQADALQAATDERDAAERRYQQAIKRCRFWEQGWHAREAALQRVRALHNPWPALRELLGEVRNQECGHCHYMWPCPTVAALGVIPEDPKGQ